MTIQRIMMFAGLGLLVAVLGLLVWLILQPTPVAPGATPVAPQTPEERRVDVALGALERICLSNVSSASKDAVIAGLKTGIGGIGADASAEKVASVVRGAAADLPAAEKASEGVAIRTCLAQNFDKVLAALGPAKAAAIYPDPLDARIVLTLAPDAPPDADVVAHIRGARRIFDGEVLARQRDDFYLLRLPYPADGETYDGNIVRSVLREAVNAPAHASRLCFKRPDKPAEVPDTFVKFDCAEGKACALDAMSPAWVATCPVETASAFDWSRLSLIGTAHAQGTAKAWSVPSRRTWETLRPNLKGVGYTGFEVKTDAFAGSGAYGVEVALAVNGVPVLEDGLPPADRPLAYAGKGPFTYVFGLRSLDLQGSRGGCDRIDLTLTPLGARPGTRPVRVARDYVVLRSLPARRVGAVDWVGTYWKPVDAYENEVFLSSLRYAPSLAEGSGAAFDTRREAVRAQALAEKRRFDGLGLRFKGQPLRAVIRPPLRDAAFGLAVGAIDDSGRFRFTFAMPEARALMDAVLAARAASPAARAIIAKDVFVYRVGSAVRASAEQMPPGVCGPIGTSV